METENYKRERKKKTSFFKRQFQGMQPETEEVPPKPFFKKQLIVQLLTIAAVVLAVFIGTSIFFKVDTVTVTGAQKYDVESVINASEIEMGDSLLFFGKGATAKRIKLALPYIGSVRFEVKLPGTVNIIVEEKTVAYTMVATDKTKWKVTSDGIVVEKVTDDQTITESVTTVTGFQIKKPEVGQQAVAYESSTQTTTNAERLAAALDVLAQLEDWKMFSRVTDVDVSDYLGIKLTCTNNYRVELGTSEDLSDKIGAVKAALTERENAGAESGVLEPIYDENTNEWLVRYSPWT